MDQRRHVLYGTQIPRPKGQLLGGKNVPGHARRHSAVSCVKIAKPIDLLFGLWTWVDRRKHVQSYSPGGANVPSWEGTLTPPGEYDFAGGDAALCQTALTTCLSMSTLRFSGSEFNLFLSTLSVGELRLHLTQCRLVEAYLRTK